MIRSLRLCPVFAAVLLLPLVSLAEEPRIPEEAPPELEPLESLSTEELDVRLEGLSVSIEAIRREHSKDSNTQRYTVQIEGRKVHYSGNIGPSVRGQSAIAEVDFELDDEAARKLLRGLRRKGLRSSIEEEKSRDVGIGIEISVSCTVQLGAEQTTIRVAGIKNSWGKEKSENLSEEARAASGAIFSLAKQMRRIADTVWEAPE